MRGAIRGLAIVLAAAVVAALPAAAQGPGHYGRGPGGPGGPGGPHGQGMIAHMAQELGLSAEQQTRIKEVVSKYRDGTLGSLRTAMHEARGTLGETIHDPEATDAQVQEAVAAVSKVEAQLAADQHHMALEINAVLNAEQRAKFAQLRLRHRERGGGPPPPPDGGF